QVVEGIVALVVADDAEGGVGRGADVRSRGRDLNVRQVVFAGVAPDEPVALEDLKHVLAAAVLQRGGAVFAGAPAAAAAGEIVAIQHVGAAAAAAGQRSQNQHRQR